MPPPVRSRSTTPSLDAALAVELRRFELLTVRLWHYALTAGLLCGLVITFFISRDLGIVCTTASAAYLASFVWLYARLRQGPLGRGGQVLMILMEGTIPWVFLVAMTVAQGAEYALASWVPPMAFTMLILSYSVRLRVRSPLVVSTASAITFPLLYFFHVRGELTAPYDALLVFDSGVQITRSMSLLFCGVAAALGAHHLRKVISRAGMATREHDLFGKYQLLRPIARGGMGEVFEANYCPEGGFERRVAVKRIHPHLAEGDRFVALFRAEAELCARLTHPNVTQVLDFGRVDGSYFLAMEYVDGVPLSALQRDHLRRFRRGLPEDLCARIGQEILAGLHHAHAVARGADGQLLRVVHRDLCPANVLLSRNGEVKLSDFGVARALKNAGASFTKTIVGHASYMAPEQARAASVDMRADLFALSVILWELLAGQRLFRRDNESATLLALISDPIPAIRARRPDIHHAWEPLLEKGLSRDPTERFESAAAMLRALQAIPASRSPTATTELGHLVGLIAEDQAAKRRRADEYPTKSVTGNPSGSDLGFTRSHTDTRTVERSVT